MKKLLSTAFLSLVFASVPVVNPSFETGDLTGWVSSGALVNAGGAYDGTYKAYLVNGASMYQDVVVGEDNVVTASYYIAAGLGRAVLSFPGSSCDVVVQDYEASDWTYRELQIDPCEGYDTARIYFYGISGAPRYDMVTIDASPLAQPTPTPHPDAQQIAAAVRAELDSAPIQASVDFSERAWDLIIYAVSMIVVYVLVRIVDASRPLFYFMLFMLALGSAVVVFVSSTAGSLIFVIWLVGSLLMSFISAFHGLV